MQKLFPLELADRSWDNVGLLLESPIQRSRQPGTKPKVLLTIDLTTAVAQEALEENSGVETIVTYRMPAQESTNERPDYISRIEVAHVSRYAATVPPEIMRCWYWSILPPYQHRWGSGWSE